MRSNKDLNLCQRDRCREPYTKIVVGRLRGIVRWKLRVCDAHAQPYKNRPDHFITIRDREARKP